MVEKVNHAKGVPTAKAGNQADNWYSRHRRCGPTIICSFSLLTPLVLHTVHPHPIPALTETYRSTLALVKKSIPEAAVYRQSVEASTEHKLSIMEAAKGDVSRIENEIGQGQIEELIIAAEKELSLAGEMIEWKP